MEEKRGDFVIEDGKLVKYTGEGGDVVIPEGVTAIGALVFLFCDEIRSIMLPAGLTSIEDGAFPGSGRTRLMAITVDPDNPAFTSVDGVLFDKNMTTLLKYPGRKTGAYTIPATVTSIGERAFDGCTGLTSLTIPEGVTSIGDSAFSGCTGLSSVPIPDSVTDIGAWAFLGCTGLTSVTIPAGVSIAHAALPCDFAYILNGKKAGTYTRAAGGLFWSKN